MYIKIKDIEPTQRRHQALNYLMSVNKTEIHNLILHCDDEVAEMYNISRTRNYIRNLSEKDKLDIATSSVIRMDEYVIKVED